MSKLTCLNSGVRWYFSNSVCHSASFNGGSVPTSGCHSTIDSPECVRRVTPPTTTMANTRAAHSSSQTATLRWSVEVIGGGLFSSSSAAA